MIFLMLFSYVILCDFFPLYDFPSDKCLPTNDSNNYENNPSNKENQSENPSEFHSNTTRAYGFQPHKLPSPVEFILAIWVFTLLCEEIRQVIFYDNETHLLLIPLLLFPVYLTVSYNRSTIKKESCSNLFKRFLESVRYIGYCSVLHWFYTSICSSCRMFLCSSHYFIS